jgi:hypothetical protein
MNRKRLGISKLFLFGVFTKKQKYGIIKKNFTHISPLYILILTKYGYIIEEKLYTRRR